MALVLGTQQQLSILSPTICKRSKPCNRTLLVALDVMAAFDTVDHNLLLRDILEAPLTNSTNRWVASYLQV